MDGTGRHTEHIDIWQVPEHVGETGRDEDDFFHILERENIKLSNY